MGDPMNCTTDGCTNVVYARGWCHKHYRWNQMRNHTMWTAREQQPIHGTRKRYEKGCRCNDCTTRESEYRAAWRLRTGQTKTSRVLKGDDR